MQTNVKTILIGEDDMEVRAYLKMALKCLGYSVELAQDGDEVLACLQSSRSEISAVLLDLTMPNRDGIDTLCEIRRMNADLPVIVISGDTSTLSVCGRHEDWRHRLSAEAGSPRTIARIPRTRLRTAKPAFYGPAQRRAGGQKRLRQPQCADERDPGAGRANRMVGGPDPGPGGNRQRQGSDRA